MGHVWDGIGAPIIAQSWAIIIVSPPALRGLWPWKPVLLSAARLLGPHCWTIANAQLAISKAMLRGLVNHVLRIERLQRQERRAAPKARAISRQLTKKNTSHKKASSTGHHSPHIFSNARNAQLSSL